MLVSSFVVLRSSFQLTQCPAPALRGFSPSDEVWDQTQSELFAQGDYLGLLAVCLSKVPIVEQLLLDPREDRSLIQQLEGKGKQTDRLVSKEPSSDNENRLIALQARQAIASTNPQPEKEKVSEPEKSGPELEGDDLLDNLLQDVPVEAAIQKTRMEPSSEDLEDWLDSVL